MLEVGSVVDNKLRIERLLGRGGMGVVAIATHLQLDQLVAMKVLHDELATDPLVIQRFLREAKASAQLKSEHVCRVSDVGQLASGAPYIVMELLEGEDLSHAIEAQALSIEVACDYVLQACVAIAEAHALGIVHRDLKPGNLFVTHRIDGSVLIKVLDFGIAKAPASADFKMTSTQMVMGSPGYMSPEQLRSAKDVDARSDIWALGVILYECVSGRLPFPGQTITELAVKVAVDAPEALDDVDPAFAAIVMRCLEKSLDKRYQNVGQLAADLAAVAGPQHAATAALVARLLTVKPGGSIAMQKASASYESGVAPTMQTSSASEASVKLPAALGKPPSNIQVIVAPPETTLQGAIDTAIAAQPKKGRGALIVIVVLAAAAAVAGIVIFTRHDQKSDQIATADRPRPPVQPGAIAPGAVSRGGAPADAAAVEPVTGKPGDAAVMATGLPGASTVTAVADAAVALVPVDARIAPVDARLVPHVADAAVTDPAEALRQAESSYRAGKFAAALAEAEQALRLGSGNQRPAHLVAAKAACQLGQADAARHHMRNLLEGGREAVESVCDEHGIELERRTHEHHRRGD